MSLISWSGAPRHSAGPGPGLLWGLALSFLVWLLRCSAPMMGKFSPAALHEAFPELIRHALLLGVPLGIGLGIASMRLGTPLEDFDVTRALFTGGAAGVLGGFLFSSWMENESFFPLIAGALHCDVRLVGISIHYLVAMVAGVTFAFLFQRDLYGTGSSMAFGAVHGMVWWMLGPLTLVRLASGQPVAWSAAEARGNFSSLIAHLFYGLIVGVTYSLADALWKLLFIGSDPLHRERDSAALRALRATLWGAGAGAVLAVPFCVAVHHAAPAVAAGHTGFILFSSLGLGAAYGLLFRRETRDVAAAVCWGLVSGAFGWLAVPMTLFPLVSGDGCRWSPETTADLLPLIPVHFAHGALIGFIYGFWDMRHRDAASLDPRVVAADRRRRRPAGTPAPAVWLLILGLQMLVIALLSNPAVR